MTEPSSDSPFAEFAAPKVSAVEYIKARREQDRKGRRELWLLLAILTGAAALVAAGGASVAAGLTALPAALGMAILGTLLGVLVGWLAGAGAWALLAFRSKAPAPFKPIGADLVHGNAWDKMTIWLSLWGAIGIASGGGAGAAKGAELAVGATAESVIPWSLGGAALGVAIGLVLWLVLRRGQAGRRAEPGVAADDRPTR
jgi:hypothetical protein